MSRFLEEVVKMLCKIGHPMTSRELLVLERLADHAKDDGTNCFPSVPTLAHETYMKEDTVRSALRSLEKSKKWSDRAPLIKTEIGGGRKSNNYTIILPTAAYAKYFETYPKDRRNPVRKKESTKTTKNRMDQLVDDAIEEVDEQLDQAKKGDKSWTGRI